MFDHGVVTAALLTTDPKAELDRLRERMRRMEDGQARPELEVLPGLSQVIRLRAGGLFCIVPSIFRFEASPQITSAVFSRFNSSSLRPSRSR